MADAEIADNHPEFPSQKDEIRQHKSELLMCMGK